MGEHVVGVREKGETLRDDSPHDLGDEVERREPKYQKQATLMQSRSRRNDCCGQLLLQFARVISVPIHDFANPRFHRRGYADSWRCQREG